MEAARMTFVHFSYRVRAALAAAATLLLALGSMAAPPAVHAAGTVTTIDGPTGPAPTTFSVTVHVRPSPYDPLAIGRCVSVDLDGANLICLPLDASGDASREFTGVALGAHTVHATWGGATGFDASGGQASVQVGRATTTTVTISTHTAVDTQPVTLTGTVTPESGGPCAGSLTFGDSTVGGPVGTVALNPATGIATLATAFAIGTHSITAYYLGGPDCLPSTYTDYEMLEVTDDTAVAASSLGLTPKTFYPVKDGYRDSVAIRGTLGERARVVIRIRNAAGTLVRTRDLGTRAAGAYSWAWTGRNDLGRLLPAGRYTVTQRITDTAGNTKSWTGTVNLSRKSLHWHSRTVEKAGDAYTYYWDPGAGWVSTARSSYHHGVRLHSAGEYVAVRYTFRLHAAVKYSALTYRVLGRSTNGLQAQAGLWGAVNPAAYAKSFDMSAIGPAYRWWSMTQSSAHRVGTLVYGIVLVPAEPSTTFDVAKVRLVYRFATLE
jgi:hypothetical protein